jgi:intracellular sulfur oxidation DsrE/DsrF family protein
MRLNKNIIKLTALILFVVGLAFTAKAQIKPCPGENSGKRNYAILVRNTQHMQAALKTASQMKASGKDYDAFEVVVCGKVVNELIDKGHKQLPNMLKQAEELEVRFSVCGMSLDKFSISPEQLPEQFELVDNGLIRIFELQENCYYTIEL